MLGLQDRALLLVAVSDYIRKLDQEDASDFVLQMYVQLESDVANASPERIVAALDDDQVLDLYEACCERLGEDADEVNEELSHAMRADAQDTLDLGLHDISAFGTPNFPVGDRNHVAGSSVRNRLGG